MKFKTGETVIFKKNTRDSKYAWELTEFEKYTVTNHSFKMSNSKINYIAVNNIHGTETNWYNEEDFITIQEYRKYKLRKLNKYNYGNM